MIEVLFFLVIKTGHGLTTIPAPFVSEAACKQEAARISRPSSQGGMPEGFGYCVRVETPRR